MARKSMGGRQFAKKYTKARKKTRAINTTATILRGGVRL